MQPGRQGRPRFPANAVPMLVCFLLRMGLDARWTALNTPMRQLFTKIGLGLGVVAAVFTVVLAAAIAWLGSGPDFVTRRVEALLNETFVGTFEIARVAYRFPTGIEVDGLRGTLADGDRALRLATLSAEVELAPLFSQRVKIGEVIADDVTVSLAGLETGMPAVARLFEPSAPSASPDADDTVPWSWSVEVERIGSLKVTADRGEAAGVELFSTRVAGGPDTGVRVSATGKIGTLRSEAGPLRGDDLELSAELSGIDSGGELAYDLLVAGGIDVADRGRVDRLEARGAFDEATGRLTAEKLVVATSGGAVDVRGYLDVLPTRGADEPDRGSARHALTVTLTDVRPDVWEEAAKEVAPLLMVSGAIELSGGDLLAGQTQGRARLEVTGVPGWGVLSSSARLEIDGRFDKDSVRGARLHLTSKGTSVTLQGEISWDPAGQRPWLTAIESTGTLSVSALRLPNAAVTVDATLPYRWGGGRLQLADARIDPSAGGVLEITGSLALADARGEASSDPGIELQLRGKDLPVGTYVAMAGSAVESLPDVRGRVDLEATISRSLNNPRVHATLELHDGQVATVELAGHIEATATRTQIALVNTRLSTDGATLELEGSYDIPKQQVDARVELREGTLRWLEHHPAVAAAGLEPAGKVEASLQVAGTLPAPRATGTVSIDELALMNLPLGRLDIAVDAEGASTMTVTAELSGPPVTRLTAEATLHAPEPGASSDASPNAPYTGEGTVTVRGMDLAHIGTMLNVSPALSGTAGADLRWSGPISRPEVSGRASLRDVSLGEATLGDEPVELVVTTSGGTGERTQGPAGALVYGVDITLPRYVTAHVDVAPYGPLRIDGRGQIDELHLNALVPQLAESPASVVVDGEVSMSYHADGPGLTGEVLLSDLRVLTASQQVMLVRPARVRLDASGLSIDDGIELLGPGTELTVRGKVGDALRLRAVGRIDGSLLAVVVPAIAQARGQLEIDGTLSGSRDAPEGSLTLTPRDLEITTRSPATRITLAHGAIEVRAGEAHIRDLRGELQRGRFSMSGRIGLDPDWMPKRYDVSFEASGLALHQDGLTLSGAARMALTGTGLIPDVSGRIELNRVTYRNEIELRSFALSTTDKAPSRPLSETAPQLGEMGLDIAIITRGPADVNVRAGAASVSAELESDVRVLGTPLAPLVRGQVSVVAGEVVLPHATLEVDPSSVRFLGPVDRATVSLQASGSAESKDLDRERHWITLRVEGTPDEMVLSLDADPTLTRLQILSLLLTGRTGMPSGGGGSSVLAAATGTLASPVTGFAEDRLEGLFNIELGLRAGVSDEGFEVGASQDLTERLRIESTYARSVSESSATTSLEILLYLTNRLLLEGDAALESNTESGDSEDAASLELKYRIFEG